MSAVLEVWRAEHVRSGKEPGEYRATFGPLEIIIHRWIQDPGKWFVSCHRLGLERLPLDAVTVSDAQREGLSHVRRLVGHYGRHLGLNVIEVKP